MRRLKETTIVSVRPYALRTATEGIMSGPSENLIIAIRVAGLSKKAIIASERPYALQTETGEVINRQSEKQIIVTKAVVL